MYFRRSLLIALCLVTATLMLLTGMFGGVSYQSTKHQEAVRVQNLQSKRIAVVNQDLGIEYRGRHVNFSQVVIESIIKDCVTVSREGGETGLINGTYGIMIVFPANFSDYITKINDYTPQKVKLKYSVNPNLSQQDTIDIITKLLGIEANVNDALSYMYISSVFDELHSAQDNVSTVLVNDKKDMDALNAIQRMDMVAPLKLTSIEREPLKIKEIGLSDQIKANDDITKDTLKVYDECYKKAQKDYDAIAVGYSAYKNAEVNWRGQTGTMVNQIVPGFTDVSVVTSPGASDYNSRWYVGKSNLDTAISNIYGIPSGSSDVSPGESTSDELLGAILAMIPDEKKDDAKKLLEQYGVAGTKNLEEIQYKKVQSEVDKYFNNATQITTQKISGIKYTLSSQITLGSSTIDPLIKTADSLLSDYQPNKFVDERKPEISKLNTKFSENTKEIEKKMNEKTHTDIEYIMKVYTGCDEYVMKLKDDITKTKDESDRLFKSQVDYFSVAKTQTSSENKQMMNEFAIKLPNTRIGSQGNTNVYQFMASPIQALDINYGSLPTAYDNELELLYQQNLLKLIILILLIIAVTILIVYAVITNRRRRIGADDERERTE